MRYSFRNVFLSFIVIALASNSIALARESVSEAWALEKSTGFIRTWLLCGVFPNPPHEGDGEYDHTPPCVGLETDYLVEHGGEAKVAPVAGMVHRRPDGTEARWFEYTSPSDIIDFTEAFQGQSATNVVAYAYTTINVEAAGKAIMALGSDDGIKIWINGNLTHDLLVARGVVKDNDFVDVNLEKGENRLLVKVEQGGGGWGFVLRFLGKDDALAIQAQKKLMDDLMQFQNCSLRPVSRWDYMFPPGSFPQIVWDRPDLVEKIMGSFPLKVRWFNNRLEEVAKPDEPGRYMAYVEGQTPSGLNIRRSLTLYCRPESWQPWYDNIKTYVDYMPNSPINREAWEERRELIASWLGTQFVETLQTTDSSPILLSYLHEMEPSGKDILPIDNPWVTNEDRQLALKRKLLNVEGRYPPLRLPGKSGNPAPVLRNGTPGEAGVKENSAERIRSICREWYEESKEPFVILVARRGVIIIHEVFDQPDGPTKLDTALEIASISKAMTGMMFAQFLDQGLIGLEDPVGKYLPDFPVEGDKAIALRQCFTHTTGLAGHYEWGGIHNPWLDNVIANGLGYLTPGKVHSYNGMGYDLAGKVMEVVSGKSVPRLFYENFLEPLGVKNTTVDDLACCNVRSAEDLARMGQLLLNRGSYGDQVFFSPETFEELMPKQLSRYYPELDSSIEWGIGLTWMRANDPDAEGKTLLSKNTIGHGAASSAIFMVDLDNQVVVAQARRTAGPKYQEYAVKFLKAIDEGIVED